MNQAVGAEKILFRHQELPGETPLEQQRAERAGRGAGIGGRGIGLLGGIASQQLLHRVHAARGAGGGADAGAPQGRIHLGDRRAEGALHVGDAELEERGPLHDLPGARRVAHAGQLHYDPVVPHPLHQGLRHAEFVNARADDAQGALQRVPRVCHLAAALVHFQRQVNAALEVQSFLDGDAVHDGVPHSAIGAAGPDGFLAGPQADPQPADGRRPDGNQDQTGDDEKTISDIRWHGSRSRRG